MNRSLGWSYTGTLVFVGIPALLIWITRRNWIDYGVSLVDWRTNLDLGIKAYLVRFIPLLLGLGGATMLGLNNLKIAGGAMPNPA